MSQYWSGGIHTRFHLQGMAEETVVSEACRSLRPYHCGERISAWLQRYTLKHASDEAYSSSIINMYLGLYWMLYLGQSRLLQNRNGLIRFIGALLVEVFSKKPLQLLSNIIDVTLCHLIDKA